MNTVNKETNTIKIIVNLIGEKAEEVFIKSKDIICPKCQESCKIKIKKGKIKLYDCINKNITDNIKIKDFPDTQKINISNI